MNPFQEQWFPIDVTNPITGQIVNLGWQPTWMIPLVWACLIVNGMAICSFCIERFLKSLKTGPQ